MKLARALMLAAGLAALLAIPATVGAQAPRTLTVNLTAAQSNTPGSGVNGTATLTDIGGGRTRVEVRVSTGGNPNMPAHIHDGRCPGVGPVRFPLTNVMNGTSTTEVNTTIADLLAGTFAINLHQSPQNAQVYVSCGAVVAGPAALPLTGGAPVPAGMPAAAIGGAVAAVAAAAAGAGLWLRRRFR